MRAALAAVLLGALNCVSPVRAARPLLDNHQWDKYFALFAQDVAVPWKTTQVRLDSYSGAAVDFAAFAVDPAEVIVAGANRSARAIDTSHSKAVVRWRFSPPAGYRFESSDVSLPLGAREGFFVIEARRGDATQQVWVNRTHIGLLAKSSPEGLVVWGVDLRSGRPLGGMRVQFLAGNALVEMRTDSHGLIFWRGSGRPSFALAQDGPARAFATLLPQAPVPAALVAVRAASAVVRAGDAVAVVGFVRRRSGTTYRRAGGEARVRLLGRGKALADTSLKVDEAGAFSGQLVVPAGTVAGDYALLATAGGAVGGTTLHVDAASDLALTVSPRCPCLAGADIGIAVVATRDHEPVGGVPVRLEIVRTPHVLPPGDSDAGALWGTTTVSNQALRTGSDGHAAATIRPPSDGLGSTYSIRVATGGNGATASTQLSVPTSVLALTVEPDAAAVDVGQAIGLTVRAFDSAAGTPSAGIRVAVRLSHGATAAAQTVQLGADGRAHVVFHAPSLGSNLVLASATGTDGRPALDAAAVLVAPTALRGRTGTADTGDLEVHLDRERYRPGGRIGVQAQVSGSQGSALITLEGARTFATRIVPVVQGRIAASLDLGEAQGDVRVGVATVRDGAVLTGSAPVQIDGPGHPRALTLVPDHANYAEEAVASVAFRGGNAGYATVVARLSDGRPSDGAFFGNVADVLASGATSSENPAAASRDWHTWVAPARSKASDIFAAEAPRPARASAPSIGAAAPNLTYWHVGRQRTDAVTVPLPAAPGTYILSVLAIYDDGDVGAATAALVVRRP